MYNRLLFRSNVKLQGRELEELQSLPKSLINNNYSNIFKEYQIVDRVPIFIEEIGGQKFINLLSGKVYINQKNGLFVDIKPTRLLLPAIDGIYSINLSIRFKEINPTDTNFFELLSSYKGLKRETYISEIGINNDGYPLFVINIKNGNTQVIEYRGEPTRYIIPNNKYEVPRLFSKEITQTINDLADSFISSGFKISVVSQDIVRVSPGTAYIEGVRINIREPIYINIENNGGIYINKLGSIYFEGVQENVYDFKYVVSDGDFLTDSNNNYLVYIEDPTDIRFTRSRSLPICNIVNGEIKRLTRFQNINPYNLVQRLDKLESEILLLASKKNISDSSRVNNNIVMLSNKSGDIFHPLYSAYYDPFESSIQNAVSIQSDNNIFTNNIIAPENIIIEGNKIYKTNRNLTFITDNYNSNGYITFDSNNLIFDYFPKQFNNNLDEITIEVYGLAFRDDYEIFLNGIKVYDKISANSTKSLEFNIKGAKLNDYINIKDSSGQLYGSYVINNVESINYSNLIKTQISITEKTLVSDLELEIRAATSNMYGAVYIKSKENILAYTIGPIVKGNNLLHLVNSTTLFPGSYEILMVFTESCFIGALNNIPKIRLVKENITPILIPFQINERINNIRTTNTNLQLNTEQGWKTVTEDLETRVNIEPVNLRFVLDENKPVINLKDYYISRELTLDSGIWVSVVNDVKAYTGVQLYIQGSFSRGSIDCYVSSDKSTTWNKLDLISEEVVSSFNNIVNRIYRISNLSNTVVLANEGVIKRKYLSFRIDLNSFESIVKVTSMGYTLS